MNELIPLNVQAFICWWTILLGPVAAVAIVVIASGEPNPWAIYPGAVLVLAGWVYSFFLLRRVRRAQRKDVASTQK